MSEIYCKGKIYEEKPDMKFFREDTEDEIEVSDVILDVGGCITSIVDSEGTELFPDEFKLCKDFLEIKGIGYVMPGCRVRFNGKYYVLNFGDHVNISNQKIYSWYLSPVGDVDEDPLGRPSYSDLTLQVCDVDKIDVVNI